jgi:diguanylate cyclase (GGDEF)-like protein
MSLEQNALLNAYSLAILLIIYFHARRSLEHGNLSDRLYMWLLHTTALLLGLDVLSRFDGNASPLYVLFNHIGNFLMFLLNLVLPSLWVAYVHFQVHHDERRIRRLIYPLFTVNAINACALTLSQCFGWFYYIDAENVYHRGPFFLIPVTVVIALIVVAIAIIVINRRNLDRKSFFSLVFFAIPPFVSIILQVRYYGFSLVMNGVVLSLLVVFLNIQNHSMYTDYLTGLSNRKRLDAYLREKISLSTREKAFSAILIDINNFKYINDTYGHSVGDHALQTVAKLLKSCLRASDFIARYGGDEFCIVLDISNQPDLEAVVGRINDCAENHNRTGSHLYRLEFSMGYALYDCAAHGGAEEFLKQIDMLMYEDKQGSRSRARA